MWLFKTCRLPALCEYSIFVLDRQCVRTIPPAFYVKLISLFNCFQITLVPASKRKGCKCVDILKVWSVCVEFARGRLEID